MDEREIEQCCVVMAEVNEDECLCRAASRRPARMEELIDKYKRLIFSIQSGTALPPPMQPTFFRPFV